MCPTLLPPLHLPRSTRPRPLPQPLRGPEARVVGGVARVRAVAEVAEAAEVGRPAVVEGAEELVTSLVQPLVARMLRLVEVTLGVVRDLQGCQPQAQEWQPGTWLIGSSSSNTPRARSSHNSSRYNNSI
ncbi:unnamed protein product [Closterium sp. NIES-54]